MGKAYLRVGLFTEAATKTPQGNMGNVASTRYTTWTMEQSQLYSLDLHILQWFLELRGSGTSLGASGGFQRPVIRVQSTPPP